MLRAEEDDEERAINTKAVGLAYIQIRVIVLGNEFYMKNYS
jgi:hypothetical protein